MQTRRWDKSRLPSRHVTEGPTHGDSVLGKVSKDTRMLCGLMAAT
jgi:hypothetical protein